MNQEAIWDHFQNEAVDSFSDSQPRQEFLVRQLPRGARVLNIGVGAGNFERAAQAAGLDIHCLDPNERAIARLRETLGLGEKAQAGYSQALPFGDATFDAVVMSEVLEHLSDEIIAGTLEEVRRVLVPGGRFLGTVPARERLESQHVVCPSCSHHFHRWGHVQSFDAARLRAVLSARLEVETLHETHFVSWRSLNWKGKLVAAARAAARGLGAHSSGESLYFVARKPRREA